MHNQMTPALSGARLPGELLREVALLYTRAQRAVAECCRTSNTQCQLLVELGRSGPVTLNALGARLNLDKSWVSRAVDGLVERGWATKEPNPLDARSWLVTLTADGEGRVRDLNTTLDNHAARVLQHLSAPDRATVEKSLLLLLKALREDVDIVACCPAPQAWASTKDRKSCC